MKRNLITFVLGVVLGALALQTQVALLHKKLAVSENEYSKLMRLYQIGLQNEADCKYPNIPNIKKGN